MENIEFLVQGSAKEPYTVSVVNRGKRNLSAYCTCPAGENGLICKHRTRIFAGDTQGIVEGIENVPIAQEWFRGSDIEKALNGLSSIESNAKKAERVFKEMTQMLQDKIHENMTRNVNRPLDGIREKPIREYTEAAIRKVVTATHVKIAKRQIADAMMD